LSGLGCFPVWASLVAVAQSRGRGQLRRSWHSPPGNLYVTFRLPEETLFLHEAAPLLTGYLVQQALERMGVSAKLKWPNDILLQQGRCGAKVGGLLLEAQGDLLLAGLGINLRVGPPASLLRDGSATPTTSLASFDFAPLPFWLTLVSAVRECYARSARCSVQEVLARAEGVLAWKDIPVLAEERETRAPVRITGLGSRGELLLTGEGGKHFNVTSGSIRPWHPDTGD
jgi:BirA family biotin operon repressor/biotin-[acetyl-CoA-carboxylase] ligase